MQFCFIFYNYKYHRDPIISTLIENIGYSIFRKIEASIMQNIFSKGTMMLSKVENMIFSQYNIDGK